MRLQAALPAAGLLSIAAMHVASHPIFLLTTLALAAVTMTLFGVRGFGSRAQH